jgi:P22 coat protein - gene protein 5
MSNTLITSSIVAKEVLAILENTNSFAQYVNREYDEEFTGNMSRGYEPGQTINIKRPSRYTYRAGRVAVPQASVDTTVPLTLSQGGADLAFTSGERTLSITSDHIQGKLMAAAAAVVSEIDRQGLALAKFATYNTLNAAGALPATQLAATQVMADVNTRLDIMSAPVKDGNRAFVMGPVLNGALIPGFAGLFNQSEKINGQYRTGYMNDAFGLHPMMDQAVSTHTNGAATATNINGAGQTGSAITVVAVAGGTLTRGTTITLPGVNWVNAQTREDTGVPANVVVTADALVGATTINVSPALVTSGAYQNVTASPTTATPYVILGAASTSYKTNIGFHKNAFTLAMVPMWKPMDGMGARVSQKTHNGFTIKVTDFYDGVNDNGVMRLDVLFGWAATYPELSTRYMTTS